MGENEERRSLTEVRDRPTEIWMKALVGVTLILVGLISYMGDRVITGQDKQLEQMSKINGILKAYEPRISRNEQDIKELENFYHNIKSRGK